MKGAEYQLYDQLTLEFWPDREKGRVKFGLLYERPRGPEFVVGVGVLEAEVEVDEALLEDSRCNDVDGMDTGESGTTSYS